MTERVNTVQYQKVNQSLLQAPSHRGSRQPQEALPVPGRDKPPVLSIPVGGRGISNQIQSIEGMGKLPRFHIRCVGLSPFLLLFPKLKPVIACIQTPAWGVCVQDNWERVQACWLGNGTVPLPTVG